MRDAIIYASEDDNNYLHIYLSGVFAVFRTSLFSGGSDDFIANIAIHCEKSVVEIFFLWEEITHIKLNQVFTNSAL